jgi:hypothetical protein
MVLFLADLPIVVGPIKQLFEINRYLIILNQISQTIQKGDFNFGAKIAEF